MYSMHARGQVLRKKHWDGGSEKGAAQLPHNSVEAATAHRCQLFCNFYHLALLLQEEAQQQLQREEVDQQDFQGYNKDAFHNMFDDLDTHGLQDTR